MEQKEPNDPHVYARRRIRYAPREIESLTRLVIEEVGTQDKEVDSSNIKLKRQVWQNVQEKFNQIPGFTQRTASQLQKAWENLKFKKKHEQMEKNKFPHLMPPTLALPPNPMQSINGSYACFEPNSNFPLNGTTPFGVTPLNGVPSSAFNGVSANFLGPAYSVNPVKTANVIAGEKTEWNGNEYWLLSDGRLLPKVNFIGAEEHANLKIMDTVVTESRKLEMKPCLLPSMPAQPDYFSGWNALEDEPPDHGLWPISSILEHMSEDELQRMLEATKKKPKKKSERPSSPPATPPEEEEVSTANGEEVSANGEDRRRHQCPVCRKYFTQASSLRVHGRIHTGEKPFQCEVCHKSFNQSGSLRLHKTVHSTERPYDCDVCKKSFSRVRSLRLHMKTHSSHKPFKCTQCEKAFHHNANLKVHQKIHDSKRPFTCDDCFKEFDKHESLVHHARTHRNLKPFACEICGKRFPTPQSLGSHGKVHREKVFDEEAYEKKLEEEGEKEEKVYTCEVCPKTYTNIGSWRAHRRSHNKKPKGRKRRKRRGRRQ